MHSVIYYIIIYNNIHNTKVDSTTLFLTLLSQTRQLIAAHTYINNIYYIYIYIYIQLGSVQRYLNPKIKCLGKYLFSRASKHTIGNCSSRYVQIRCNYKIGQFLQKLKILKSKIFYWLFNCTQKRCATIQNLQIYFFLQNLDLLWLCI